MNAPDPAVLAQADDLVTDAVVRRCFGVGPVEDPSGLLGQPSGAPPAEATEDEMHDAYMRRHFPGSVAVAPAPKPEPPATGGAAGPLPKIAQGPRSPAPGDDGAMVDEYVRTFWPQTSR